MRIYFNHNETPDGLPQDAILWPELDGASMIPRTEREIQAFVKGLPGDAVVLTNSDVALTVARTMRATNPETVTVLEIHLPGGRVVKFDEDGRTDNWDWHDDVVSKCLAQIAKTSRNRHVARKAKVQP